MRNIRSEIDQALEITRQMHDFMKSGELDSVERLASERSPLLQDIFRDEVTAADVEYVKNTVQQIMELNTAMLGLEDETRKQMEEELKHELGNELAASSAIRSYVENSQ